MSHVMGQICSLVLDSHRHPVSSSSSGSRRWPLLLPQQAVEPDAARKAAGFAAHAHAQALRTGSMSSDGASDASSEDNFGGGACFEPQGSRFQAEPSP